jgi:hypothetical protein
MDKEKLIPINFPPYQFEEEDKKLALQINGLKFSHVINPKPFAPVFHFHVDEQTTLQSVLEFLNSLPDNFQIQYFRPFKPSESVAGATVTVQRWKSDYCFYNDSHGQDKIWRTIAKEELADELFVYRQHQSFGTIRVSRVGKKAILEQKAY